MVAVSRVNALPVFLLEHVGQTRSFLYSFRLLLRTRLLLLLLVSGRHQRLWVDRRLSAPFSVYLKATAHSRRNFKQLLVRDGPRVVHDIDEFGVFRRLGSAESWTLGLLLWRLHLAGFHISLRYIDNRMLGHLARLFIANQPLDLQQQLLLLSDLRR